MLADFLVMSWAFSALIGAGAVYILVRACLIPYEAKTDRIWKYGDESAGAGDDPAPKGGHPSS